MAQREKIIVEAEDRASREFKKAETGFRSLSKELKKLATFGGLAVAAKKLFDFGKVAIGAAVDAEEAGAGFETVFGPSFSTAAAFVDDFAHKAGFANHQLEQMLMISGNVAIGLGATEAEAADLSIEMATLAGDVASFSNAQGGAQAVMAALQSSLTGETEALKTYGLVITQADVSAKALTMTGKDHASQLTRLDKATATVTLAYERAGKAVGDLDRTQDSTANTMRRVNALWVEAQVAIGQLLIPALDALMPLVEDLIPVVVKFAGSTLGGLSTVIKVISPALQIVADILDAMPGPVIAAGVAFAGMSMKMGGMRKASDHLRLSMMDLGGGVTGKGAIGKLRGGLKSLTSMINPYTLAIGAGIAALTMWNNHKKEAAERAKEMQATLEAETGALTVNTMEWAKNKLAADDDLKTLNAMGISVEEFLGRLEGGTRGLEVFTQAEIDAAFAAGLSLQDIDDLSRKTVEFGDAVGTARDDLAEETEAMRLSREATIEHANATTASRITTLEMAEALGVQTIANVSAADALGKTREAGWSVTDMYTEGRLVIDIHAQSMWRNMAAAQADKDAADLLAEQMGTLAGRLDLAHEAQESLSDVLLAAASPVFGAVDAFSAYQGALSRYDSLAADTKTTSEELAAAQLEIAEMALRAQGSLDQLDPTALDEGLASIALALGVPKEEARLLLQELGLIDGMTATTVVDVQIGDIPTIRVPVRVPNISYAASGTPTSSGFSYFHRGGPVGRLNTNGDVPAVLQTGEYVLNRRDAARLGGPGGIEGLVRMARRLTSAAQPSGASTGAPAVQVSGRPVEVVLKVGRRELARELLPATVTEIEGNIGKWKG